MTNLTRALAMIFLLVAVMPWELSAAVTVPIEIDPSERTSDVIVMGLPFAPGVLKTVEPTNIRIRGGGFETGATSAVRSQYPDGSVRWLNIEFPAATAMLDAGRANVVIADNTTAPKFKHIIRMTETAGKRRIDTGRFVIEFDERYPLPIAIHDAAGKALVKGAPQVFRLRDSARGEARLGGKDGSLTWTVWRNSPLRVVLQVEGSYLTRDGQEAAKACITYEIKAGQPQIDFSHRLINTKQVISYEYIGFKTPTPATAGVKVVVRDAEQQGTISTEREGRFFVTNLLKGQTIDYGIKSFYDSLPDHWFTRWQRSREQILESFLGSDVPRREIAVGSVIFTPIGAARTHEMRMILPDASMSAALLTREFDHPAYAIAAPAYITDLDPMVWPVMTTVEEGHRYFPNTEKLISGYWNDYRLRKKVIPMEGWHWYGRWPWFVIGSSTPEGWKSGDPVQYQPKIPHVMSHNYNLPVTVFYAGSRAGVSDRSYLDFARQVTRYNRDYRFHNTSGPSVADGGFRGGNDDNIARPPWEHNPDRPLSTADNGEPLTGQLLEYFLFDKVESEQTLTKFASLVLKTFKAQYPMDGTFKEKAHTIDRLFHINEPLTANLLTYARAYEFTGDKAFLPYLRDLFDMICEPEGKYGVRHTLWLTCYSGHRYLGAIYKPMLHTHFLYKVSEATCDPYYAQAVIKAWLPSHGGLCYRNDHTKWSRADGHLTYQNRMPLHMSRVLDTSQNATDRKWAADLLSEYIHEVELAADEMNAARAAHRLDEPDGWKRWKNVLILDTARMTELVGGRPFQRYRYYAGGAHVNTLFFYALPAGAKALVELGRHDPASLNSRTADVTPLVNPQERMANALKRGKAYLAENAKRDGVLVTESGLQYEVLREGAGKKPKRTDKVLVRYTAKSIDGKVAASTDMLEEPADVRIPYAIRGWQEALQLMPVGAKYRFVIPTNLAYASRNSPDVVFIPNNEPVIVEFELLDIIK